MRYSRGPLSVAEEVEGRENDEKRLLRYLMRGYERDVRPVRNATTPVVIQLSITLTQIFDMDEKNQVLTSIVWLDQVRRLSCPQCPPPYNRFTATISQTDALSTLSIAHTKKKQKLYSGAVFRLCRFLSRLGMEGRAADVGPCRLWRHQSHPDAVRTNLAAGHSPL